MPAVALAVSLKTIWLHGGGGDALIVLGDEWNGLALDFISNTYANRVAANQAETLLGSGPGTAETGVGLSFTDNSYALGTA